MEIIKEALTITVLLGMVIGNVYALWKFKNSFVSKEDCKTCKEVMKVVDDKVREDIENIKSALVSEERHLKTLGVIQIVMCRHIGINKEEIDMFKDAIKNGTDVTSLL